jgi:CO/xanthine dehydrogenase Mo-binding subunit
MTPAPEILKQVEDALSRRNLLKRAGMLVVSFAGFSPGPATSQTRPGPYPDVDFHQLDSWIVIHEDSSATFYVGKTDCGQGTGTSFRQLMADELDVAYEKTTCIMGSTDAIRSRTGLVAIGDIANQ